MEYDTTISAPVLKVLSMWALVGITSWAEFASFVAAMYTLLLMIEWFWKKFWRPLFVRRGWVAPKATSEGSE